MTPTTLIAGLAILAAWIACALIIVGAFSRFDRQTRWGREAVHEPESNDRAEPKHGGNFPQ